MIAEAAAAVEPIMMLLKMTYMKKGKENVVTAAEEEEMIWIEQLKKMIMKMTIEVSTITTKVKRRKRRKAY